MQLKNSYKILLFLFIISCQSIDKNKEEIAVLGVIYNTVPKVIPPPPPLKNEMDTILVKQKKLKYAIYNKFINLESKGHISNIFYKYDSGKLFDEVMVDSISIQLARSLVKLDYNKNYDKKEFDKYANEELIYLNERFPNREEKRKHNIDRVISFSRVAFDITHSKAAVCVGIYYDKLSTSQTIYILEKEDDKWKIKFIEVVEVS
jgi:hypothetical protein